jgi:hypothetical protein
MSWARALSRLLSRLLTPLSVAALLVLAPISLSLSVSPARRIAVWVLFTAVYRLR